MAQFFGIEDIKDLTKTSQTTIGWASGSYIRIAGQAYNVSSALTLNLASDIDTGAVTSDTIYYIYAVVSGTVSLKYSLSNTAPTGFAAYRKIGTFVTDGSAEVLALPKKDEGRVGDVIQSMLTEAQFVTENGAGWVLADGRSAVGSKYAALIGASVPDLRGQFLRGKNNGRADGQENSDGEKGLGVAETAQLGAHTHSQDYYYANTSSSPQINGLFANFGGDARYGHVGTRNSGSSGSTETRPKNVTVNYFIKIEDIAI